LRGLSNNSKRDGNETSRRAVGSDKTSSRSIAPLHPGESQTDTAFRAILFTDLKGSTDRTSRLGDDNAMEFLRGHNAIVREKLSAHGGRELKHTGDGFMACFASVHQAVQCAIDILRAVGETRNALPY
jgi:class 3 adenylate cyclase